MDLSRTEPLLSRSWPVASAALRITILGGPDAGQSYTVERRRVLIGRGETADVRVTDRTVSQCHAELIALFGSERGAYTGATERRAA